MASARRAGGWLLAALATVVLVGLSQVPYDVSGTEAAELRVAWRYRSASLQQCRPLTDEENAALPAHMRQDEICARRLQPWRLTIWIDDARVADDTIRARGAREDRPLYVFRKLPMPPGDHALRVVFAPVGPADRPPLHLDATLHLEQREVALVTYDTDADGLVLRHGPGP